MRELRRYVVALCAAVCCAISVAAQGRVELADARFEPDSVLLGDHFDLVLEVVSEGNVAVGFPSITPEFAEGRIELIAEQGVDTLSTEEGRYHLRKRWRMTSFEPAMYSIDSIGVLWTDGERIDTLFASEPLALEVAMIPVDTAQKTIYDIKQPLPMPLLWGEVVEVGSRVLGVLVALGALVAAVVFMIRARKKRAGEAGKPKEPAHVIAIRELERLSNQKLWQNGKIKEYYSRLTEILREYLEGRYGVGAMEMTSDQIVVAMRELEVEPRHIAKLGELLAESDLVKFAKYIPSEESHEENYNVVYYFVEESKEVAEDVAKPEAQEPEEVVVNQEEKRDDEE